jgi:hypothetical protein
VGSPSGAPTAGVTGPDPVGEPGLRWVLGGWGGVTRAAKAAMPLATKARPVARPSRDAKLVSTGRGWDSKRGSIPSRGVPRWLRVVGRRETDRDVDGAGSRIGRLSVVGQSFHILGKA